MKKSVLPIILIVAFLSSCQATPVLESTATIAPTNTIEPTSTSIPFTPTPSNTPVPPTPTEIYINPNYLAGLEKWKFDKQFPLKTMTAMGTNKEVKSTFCAFDFIGQNKVNFEYANLTILRIAKCYFLDSNGKNQFVTIPLLIHNKELKKYYVYSAVGFVVEKNGGPSEAYFDGLFKGIIDNFQFKKYALLYFWFNNYGRMYNQKDWVAFFEKAVNLFGEPSDKYYNEGNVSEFQDFSGAENFIFPSYMWSDRGE
jgi:hypothetical protein